LLCQGQWNFFDQFNGFILYETEVISPDSATANLNVDQVHDFGYVYLNNKYVDCLDRRTGNFTVGLKNFTNNGSLNKIQIMVESMGRINYGEFLLDRKGIVGKAKLNGLILMEWNVYNLPLNDSYIRNLKPLNKNSYSNKLGLFFKGKFVLSEIGDTFLDLSKWKKGNCMD